MKKISDTTYTIFDIVLTISTEKIYLYKEGKMISFNKIEDAATLLGFYFAHNDYKYAWEDLAKLPEDGLETQLGHYISYNVIPFAWKPTSHIVRLKALSEIDAIQQARHILNKFCNDEHIYINAYTFTSLFEDYYMPIVSITSIDVIEKLLNKWTYDIGVEKKVPYVCTTLEDHIPPDRETWLGAAQYCTHMAEMALLSKGVEEGTYNMYKWSEKGLSDISGWYRPEGDVKTYFIGISEF